MKDQIYIAILEDHQSIIDGYLYRLKYSPNIKVVGTVNYGNQLEPLLNTYPVDVLILDITVQTSAENPNPFPILFTIPKILNAHPDLSILVVSMHNQSGIIKAILDMGIRGFIIKDDRRSIANLAEVVHKIHLGQTYLSPQVQQLLYHKELPSINLSDRQLEILSLCASHPGASINQLAQELKIAPSTMRNILSNIYQILKVRNRATAIMKARQMGLITPDEPGIFGLEL